MARRAPYNVNAAIIFRYQHRSGDEFVRIFAACMSVSGALCRMRTFVLCALYQVIALHSGIPQAVRLLGPRNRQVCRIKQSNLDEKRCLVPVNVLVRHFPTLETHYHNMRQFDLSPRRRNSEKERGHFNVVREAGDELINDAFLANDS